MGTLFLEDDSVKNIALYERTMRDLEIGINRGLLKDLPG